MARNLNFSGLVRLHVLHHAAEGPVYGLWLIEELGSHGYKMSPGTLYPILHGMEGSGLLAPMERTVEGRRRRLYTITSAGRKALEEGRGKVRELFQELFQSEG